MNGTCQCLLGVDIGASSLKASLVTADGRLLASAAHGIETLSPHAGWAEQDPDSWYVAMCFAVPKALREAGLEAEAVQAVSFSAGAHSSVLTDDAGRPLRPAVMWMDQRAAAEAQELRENYNGRILEIGRNSPTPTWTLPQLLWVVRNEPAIAAAARHVFMAKDYLRFRVTGSIETDVVDAEGTLLFDCAEGGWSPFLTNLAGWDVSTLPPVVRPEARAGSVSELAARECGLRSGTPVIAGSSDTAIELFGSGAVEPGQAGVKLATAGTINLVSRHPNVASDLINYSFVQPGLWYTVTGTNSCASAHKWLREIAFRSTDEALAEDGDTLFARMDAMAASVPPGSEGLLFHPYLNGERSPYWDPDLRADFLGLTSRHGRPHLARALYEGTAFSLRDCLEVFRARGLAPEVGRLVGGGARSETWQQIVADVLGMEIEIPEFGDASFGAALMAGIGVGVFEDCRDAANRCVRVKAVRRPDPKTQETYECLFGIYKRAQAALVSIDHELASFTRDPAGSLVEGNGTSRAEAACG